MICSGLVRYYDHLEPLLVDIDSVHPHPENYNEGDVEEIIASIEANGMYRPVQVWEPTLGILAGNNTWYACKELEAKVIPRTLVDCDETTARSILIADNFTARRARPNYADLLPLLDKIEERRPRLAGTGMSEHDRLVLTKLAEIPVYYDRPAQWPTFSVQVPPEMLKAFRHLTREADNDRDRFEVLLRLCGWDGS